MVGEQAWVVQEEEGNNIAHVADAAAPDGGHTVGDVGPGGVDGGDEKSGKPTPTPGDVGGGDEVQGVNVQRRIN